jgi:hypothetical protein
VKSEPPQESPRRRPLRAFVELLSWLADHVQENGKAAPPDTSKKRNRRPAVEPPDRKSEDRGPP